MNDATTTKPDAGQQQPVSRRPSRRMLLGALVAIAVLGALATYLWRQRGANDPNGAFLLSGNVDVHQVELAFRVSGRISAVKVQEGDKVSAGQILAELDPVPFQTDVDSAKADVAQAQAQLDKTRRGFRVEEVGQARATVAQRAADLENARVTLQGESVQLRPDGTFTVRFSLPDSRQIIPAVATSADGTEERTIVLAVERNTKELEPMIHDNNEI